MKPLQALANLLAVRAAIMTGAALPPSVKIWFSSGIDKRLRNPHESLDHQLGLRNRSGGRLHATSKLPALHQALRKLEPTNATTAERARLLAARVAAHRITPDAALASIERLYGRIPGSQRQLERILSGQTEGLRQLIHSDMSSPDFVKLSNPHTIFRTDNP